MPIRFVGMYRNTRCDADNSKTTFNPTQRWTQSTTATVVATKGGALAARTRIASDLAHRWRLLRGVCHEVHERTLLAPRQGA